MELTPTESENPLSGYGKTVSHVIIGLKTVKGTKQLRVDPTIHEAILKGKSSSVMSFMSSDIFVYLSRVPIVDHAQRVGRLDWPDVVVGVYWVRDCLNPASMSRH